MDKQMQTHNFIPYFVHSTDTFVAVNCQLKRMVRDDDISTVSLAYTSPNLFHQKHGTIDQFCGPNHSKIRGKGTIAGAALDWDVSQYLCLCLLPFFHEINAIHILICYVILMFVCVFGFRMQKELAMASSEADGDMIPTKQPAPSKLTRVRKRNADMIKVCGSF